MTTAPKGYIFCVSWYWKNQTNESTDVSRFYAYEYNETDNTYSFHSGIVPRTIIRDGQLLVGKQTIFPGDLDKAAQAVYIFKVPTQLWMNDATYVPIASLEHKPTKHVIEAIEEILGLIEI